MDEKLLNRYHDVKKLADGTANSGERQNALKILKKLETKYPNLKRHYTEWIKYQVSDSIDSDESPFEWQGLSSFFDRFVSFTEKAFGVREAVSAVARCSLNKRFNRKSVSITVSIPEGLYESLVVDFNHEQQRAFLDALSTQIKHSIQQDFSE